MSGSKSVPARREVVPLTHLLPQWIGSGIEGIDTAALTLALYSRIVSFDQSVRALSGAVQPYPGGGA